VRGYQKVFKAAKTNSIAQSMGIKTYFKTFTVLQNRTEEFAH
jgi:hypothetical protein